MLDGIDMKGCTNVICLAIGAIPARRSQPGARPPGASDTARASEPRINPGRRTSVRHERWPVLDHLEGRPAVESQEMSRPGPQPSIAARKAEGDTRDAGDASGAMLGGRSQIHWLTGRGARREMAAARWTSAMRAWANVTWRVWLMSPKRARCQARYPRGGTAGGELPDTRGTWTAA
jgi:hypothetical protein